MDRESRGMSLGSQFGVALGISLALPVLGIGGAVVAGWLLAGDPNLTQRSSLSWQVFFLSAAIALLLIGMLIGLFWSRVRARLRHELIAIASVGRSVASGDTPERLVVQGEDEFALLRNSINAIIDQRDQHGGGVGNADAIALQNQIERLLQEVSAVGEGDLSVTAEVTPDTLGVLADSFNYMIEELAKVVGRVQSTTNQVIGATRRILERVSELSRAAEVQSGQITQTSQQVEALAAFILGAARNATLSADAAQTALESARVGEDAVIQTIEGMQHIRDNVQDTSKKIKRLGERSQEIGDIVRIIEDLAEQTNLLALNAAIQSAMAGENGRSFAVVADEIRMLAERSGEAAKKIAALVKSIQNETQEAVVAMEESTAEVVAGSNMADNAGRALQEISQAVEHQAQSVEAISRAANERAQTSEIVALAMSRISELTRQTSAAMQDAASSVMYLAELADQLRASVSTFKLPPQQAQPLYAAPQPRMGPPMLPPSPYGPPTNSGMPALPPGYHPGPGPMGNQSGQWNLYDGQGGYPQGPQGTNYSTNPSMPPRQGPTSRPMAPFPGAGQFPTGQMPPGGPQMPPGGPPPPPPGRAPGRPYPGETAQRLPGYFPSDAMSDGPLGGDPRVDGREGIDGASHSNGR